MVDNVTKLLLELGTGFAFMGRQYHLSVESEVFYIDLLFYNVKLRSYVIIELKNERFKPEFTGQLGFYVAAVDGELATEVIGDRAPIAPADVLITPRRGRSGGRDSPCRADGRDRDRGRSPLRADGSPVRARSAR